MSERTDHQRKVLALAERAGMGSLETARITPEQRTMTLNALVEFYRLATEKPKLPDGPVPPAEPNPRFDRWVATLPTRSWAHYDLSACRLGWEAGYRRAIDESMPITSGLDRTTSGAIGQP